MFSNYKNDHKAKTALATGRTKVPYGCTVPVKNFSSAEISSIKDWINKGYLVWVDPVIPELTEPEVLEVIVPEVIEPEVPEVVEPEVIEPEVIEPEEVQVVKPKRNTKKKVVDET